MKSKTEINKIEEAMLTLGADESILTEREKDSLDQKGYVVFTEMLNAAEIETLRNKYEELMTKEGMNAGKEVHQEEGTRRLSDLVNKGACFDKIYTNPKQLAAIYHVLKREFKLSSLNARDAVPGAGLQSLHADWGAREVNEPFHVCNSIWLIDNFTSENGATRVVPGTHTWHGTPRDHHIDPRDPHPMEELIIAPAGSVGVFNSHLWQGGTLNRTKMTRRALHGYFTAREHKQQLDQAEYIRKRTYDRISPAARYILDV